MFDSCGEVADAVWWQEYLVAHFLQSVASHDISALLLPLLLPLLLLLLPLRLTLPLPLL
jgi:hypothetical protein